MCFCRFNWPITATSFFDLGCCIRRWRLLNRAHALGEIDAQVLSCERLEICMDFLGYFCGEMFLNLFSARGPLGSTA